MMSPRHCLKQSLNITLLVFENLPTQNAQAHLAELSDYMDIQKIPPNLRVVVVKQLFKYSLETSWCTYTSGISIFKDFQK